MKKLLTITLTLAMLLAFTVPTSASEETVPDTELEETNSILPPEELPLPDEPPASNEVLEEEPPVLDEAPGVSDGDEAPDVPPPPIEEETPGESDGQDIPPAEIPPADIETPDIEVPPAGQLPPENQLPPVPEVPESPEQPLEEIIQVLVPPNGNVVINPYQMPVNTSYGQTTDQIVHEPQALESFTGFPVQVSVQAAGTIRPWSNAYFVSAPPADNALDKQIFLYVEFQNDPYMWSGFYSDGPNQLLVTDWNAGKENVLTLEPFSAGYFRLSGAMAPFPEQMWSSDDAVDVTLAFTFSPVVEEAPLPAEEPAPFVPPVQEPEAFEEPSQDISTEPPAGLPAEPSEEPSEDVSAEPPEEPSEDVSAEPSEDVSADSPATGTAVEEPGGSSDSPPDNPAGIPDGASETDGEVSPPDGGADAPAAA